MEYRGFTKRRVISLAAALTLLAAGCSSPGSTPPTGAPTEPMAAPAVVGSQEALPALDPATTTLETLWAHPFYGPMVRKHSSPSSKIVFVDPAIVDQAWLDAQKYPEGTVVLPRVKGAPTYQVQGHPGGETVRPNCDYNHEMIGSSYPGADVVFAGVIYGSGSWWYRYRPEATYFYWAYAPNYPRTQDEWWLLTTCWNGPRPTPAPSATPSGDGSGGAGDPSSSPSPTPTPVPLTLTASGTFSPNGDLVKDSIPVTITGPSNQLWTLTVDGIAGSIASDSRNQSFSWDGKVGGDVLEDGRYTLRLKAGTQEDTEEVIVDTTPPAFGNISLVANPTDPTGNTYTLTAVADDRGLAGVNPETLDIVDDLGYIDTIEGLTFDPGSGTLSATVYTDSLHPSEINLSVQGEDNVGNRGAGETSVALIPDPCSAPTNDGRVSSAYEVLAKGDPPCSNPGEQRFKELTQTEKENVRVLRNWARSKGFVRIPGAGPETWGVPKPGGGHTWRLKIKPEVSGRPGLGGGSQYPRFDARLSDGVYTNPFTGTTGGRSVGTHIRLSNPLAGTTLPPRTLPGSGMPPGAGLSGPPPGAGGAGGPQQKPLPWWRYYKLQD